MKISNLSFKNIAEKITPNKGTRVRKIAALLAFKRLIPSKQNVYAPTVEKNAKYAIPTHIRTGISKYWDGLRNSGLMRSAIGVVMINPKKDTQVIIHKDVG